MPESTAEWMIQVEAEVLNPAPSEADEADDEWGGRTGRMLQAISEALPGEGPYPTQISRANDTWMRTSFPMAAPSQSGAIAAAATLVASASASAGADLGVLSIRVGTSWDALDDYDKARADED